MPVSPVSFADLQARLGQRIAAFCDNRFTTTTGQSHCAHFVGHVLGLRIGLCCGDMRYATRGTGASLRCDELFNGLARHGPWDERPQPDDGLLVFVTSAVHVKDNHMSKAPDKHVGIHHSGQVFHFSNTGGQVVKDLTLQGFQNKFRGVYHAKDVALYYGVPQ